jgi:ribosomal protein S27AE
MSIQVEDQTCPNCGREITPCVNEPAPRQGRYNGFADCPRCGAVLFTIDGEDFAEDED